MWPALLAASLGCYLFKLAGLSVPAKVMSRPTVQRIAVVLPVVLLAALITVQTFASGRSLVIDARLAGLGAAAVAVWRRWPFLVVVMLAAATAALVRKFVPGS